MFKQSLETGTVPSQWKHAQYSRKAKISPKKLSPHLINISNMQINGTHYSKSNNETSGRSKYSF